MPGSTHVKTNQTNAAIRGRFYEALDTLKKLGKLKNDYEFIQRYELNEGNFYQYRKNEHWVVDPAFLSWLIEDFGVASLWLLTGKGPMFSTPRKVDSPVTSTPS